MIKHIVQFQLADTAEGKTKAENALRIKKELEALKAVIPQIITLEVGINLSEAPATNYDLVIYSEFASMEDLSAYNVHPAHQKAAEFIGKVRTARTCVDYEV